MTLRVCCEPGCPEMTPERRCTDCASAARRRTDARRGSARERGYDRKWSRTRGRYLSLHPNCEQTGCTSKATDVHHKDGLGPSGPMGHKWANLEALCHSHHSKRTAQEQPGGWNR